jgi:hypothetical protein
MNEHGALVARLSALLSPSQSLLTEISFKATDAAVGLPSKKKVTDENNSFVT